MKKFQTPEVELVKFAMVDVIATSGETVATDPVAPTFEATMGLGFCLD